MSERTVEVEGVLLATSPDAFLLDCGDVEVWLPKSKCKWDADAKVMTMPEWLATRERLV